MHLFFGGFGFMKPRKWVKGPQYKAHIKTIVAETLTVTCRTLLCVCSHWRVALSRSSHDDLSQSAMDPTTAVGDA